MDKLKKNKLLEKISYFVMFLSVVLYAIQQGLIHNPDEDAHFLIDLGRYIVNNRALPETAYWLLIKDVPTIIQQWMCDVVNYAAYAIAGYNGIKILGILFNLILVSCLFLYCRETTGINQVGLNLAVYCWILLGQFGSTRPYSITFSISFVEFVLLRRFFAKDKHTKSETLKFFLGIVAVFVFQANWQASNILYPAFWILCYIPVIKNKKFSINLYALGALVIGLLSSCLSPIGIKGPLFLTYARGSLDRFNMVEIEPPDFPSIYTVLQLTIVALLIYAIVKKKLNSADFFLAVGCIFMSFMFLRCCWTLILPICSLIANLEFTERSHKMMRWAYAAVGLLSVFLIFRYNIEKTDDMETMVKSVPPPEEVTLFTDFNSGSYFLIDGYHIYYDARPELYDHWIAGDKAFLDEAYNVWSGHIDYDEFIERYGFNWFAVSQESAMITYMDDNPEKYEWVFTDDKDGVVIYRAIWAK